MPPWTSLLLLLVLLATAPRAASADQDSELWEAWYSLAARTRGARIDADLEAGGRLAMTGHSQGSGGLALSLDHVIDAPWKLYRVDPPGPFGGEAKVAAVVTLAEASWEALNAAESKSRTEGERRHREWLRTTDRPRELDGTFAFVVIGRETGRFRIEVGDTGSVSAVSNRLTDRWLAGPFDRFIGTWGPGSPAPLARTTPSPEGYWFWNRGEDRPFSYEPHTYQAFASALELLSLPLPSKDSEGASGLETATWLEVGPRAAEIVSTLAPRLDPESLGGPRGASTRLSVTREILPDGGRRIRLETAAESAQPHVERQTVFSSSGRPLSDRIRVHWSVAGESLDIEAGYRPLKPREESK